MLGLSCFWVFTLCLYPYMFIIIVYTIILDLDFLPLAIFSSHITSCNLILLSGSCLLPEVYLLVVSPKVLYA